jgi:hypothetical protein
MSCGVLTPVQRIIIATAQRQPGQYSRSGLAKLLADSGYLPFSCGIIR